MTDEEFLAEYNSLLHAIQSGVMWEMQLEYDRDPQRNLSPESPAGRAMKHRVTGLCGVMADHGALVRLLVEKGVIDDDEYKAASIAGLRAEKESFEARLTEHFKRHSPKPDGVKITLG